MGRERVGLLGPLTSNAPDDTVSLLDERGDASRVWRTTPRDASTNHGTRGMWPPEKLVKPAPARGRASGPPVRVSLGGFQRLEGRCYRRARARPGPWGRASLLRDGARLDSAKRRKTCTRAAVCESLVEERWGDRDAHEASNCKAISPPKVPGRGTMDTRSPQWCLPFTPPSRTQFAQDDQVFGARPFCRSRCPRILTRPRPRGPAARATFAFEMPGSRAFGLPTG